MNNSSIKSFPMNYRMRVRIEKYILPNYKPLEQCLRYRCSFSYDSEQYGNGFFLLITNEHGGYFTGIDLRYDRTFKKAEKKKWLEKWAKNYWNGENGAWLFKSLEITEE